MTDHPVGNEGVPPLHTARAEPWYQPIAEFAAHTIVGTTIFLIIAGPALLLHRLTRLAEPDGSILHLGLKIIEVTLFAADGILFLIFIFRTAWRTGSKIIRQ